MYVIKLITDHCQNKYTVCTLSHDRQIRNYYNRMFEVSRIHKKLRWFAILSPTLENKKTFSVWFRNPPISSERPKVHFNGFVLKCSERNHKSAMPARCTNVFVVIVTRVIYNNSHCITTLSIDAQIYIMQK